MIAKLLLSLLACVLASCSRRQTAPPVARVDARTVHAAPATSVPDSVHTLASLCAEAPESEPLAALCRVGKPADRTYFECEAPVARSALNEWFVEWRCLYPSRDHLPAHSFRAVFQAATPVDFTAPDPPTDLKREGPLLVASVHYEGITDMTAARALAEKIRQRLLRLGCTAAERGDIYVCGQWDFEIWISNFEMQVVVIGASSAMGTRVTEWPTPAATRR